MKTISLTLAFAVLTTTWCVAQAPIPKEKPPVIKQTNQSKSSTVLVNFISDDTCRIVIDDNAKIESRSKKLDLKPGRHSLLFESMETGKVIRDRSFVIKPEMIGAGELTYRINFRNNQ